MPIIEVGPDSEAELKVVADIMGNSRKVVVVTGAGISTNCGIPDFRSENGLYSLIQAQYDAAIKNPPWEQSNIFDIDDRPKKKRKQWYYEIVAPDGKVVDVIDEEIASPENSQPVPILESQTPQTPKRSSRSRSSITNTTTSDSRASTPSNNSSAESSLSSCSSLTPEVPISFSQIALSNDKSPSLAHANSTDTIAPSNSIFTTRDSTESSSPEPSQSSSSQTTSSREPSSNAHPSLSRNSSGSNKQSLPRLKGRDLFDSIVWQDAFKTSIFYMFISSLREKAKNVASTTDSHKFIRVLRDGNRLVRNYTQNIDLLEEREGLCTDLSEGAGFKGRFSRRSGVGVGSAGPGNRAGGCETVTLHGTLERLRCELCNTESDWDQEDRIGTTLGGSAPDCPTCQTASNKRAGNGRRKLAVGRLRPDIVLYGEDHPKSNLFGPLIEHDLALGPDVLLIMGTSLKVHGLKNIVRQFAKAVHAKGGKVIYVNYTKLPESVWGDVIDYWVGWDCDKWVLDLKSRREDLWLPPGAVTTVKAATTDRRKSSGGSEKPGAPKKSPQCTRDDRQNGAYVIFKILDQLGTFKDDKGETCKRSKYWTKRSPAPKPVKKPKPELAKIQHKIKFTNVKRSTTTNEGGTSKSKTKKQIATPARTLEDTYPQNNEASIVANLWQDLRVKAPGLSLAPPPFLQHPLLQFTGNKPEYLTPFAFKSSSNHLPNIGGGTGWSLSKMNLVTLPPSGPINPVHTPEKLVPKSMEKPKPEERKIEHSYGTRASKRFSAADTIFVDKDLANVELPKVMQSAENVHTDKAEDTIVVEETIVVEQETSATPGSDRIKRSCSIGAIVSSPEDGTTWHDAQEVL
ncbi:hypothetical protein VTL71DRAFT_2115 [Oculimacula yallundae]|uniref:Deacetylase sirtuin-type domain-containing protein n=1 Tax=Oculimacula yallundae TaxID=86028 RepID=A0ABR4C835_9HELO